MHTRIIKAHKKEKNAIDLSEKNMIKRVLSPV